jgi:hypothetical protein
MPGIDYREAVTRIEASLAGSVDTATAARKARDAAELYFQRGDVPTARVYEDEAQGHRAQLAERDRGLMVLRTEAIASANLEIARLRAAAEATVEPSTRTADELERQRLVAGRLSGDDLAAQAGAMLAAGQPRRAAMLLDAAEDKGAKMTGGLRSAVEDALDETVPQRKEAREVEAGIAAAITKIDALRLRFLAASGLGVDPQTGAAGQGSEMQLAAARVGAKLAEYVAVTSTGGEYHPADDDLATGDPGPPPGAWAALDAARALPRDGEGRFLSPRDQARRKPTAGETAHAERRR